MTDEPLKKPHHARRTLLAWGIPVLVIAVFAVAPAFVASQPKFLSRYSAYHSSYQTWSTSVHAKAACQKCHVRPGVLPQSLYSLKMLGQFYVSIVMRSKVPHLLSTPTNAACLSCHAELRTVSPRGDLRIPHRAHVDVLKMKCITCHEYLVHEKSPEGKHVPRMATCLTCHNGKRAKNACVTCHTQKAAPANHRDADWLTVHDQKQGELDCAKCHAWVKNWCAECHSRRPPSHVAKWRTLHADRVKTRRDCEVCHEGAFCIRCHGEVPTLNFNPAITLVK